MNVELPIFICTTQLVFALGKTGHLPSPGTFDGTLGSCVLSAGSDAGTVCDVKYMYKEKDRILPKYFVLV
jgi:hypothetical protein